MAKIYLSYDQKDRDFARELSLALRSLGHDITIGVDTLIPGQDWRSTLLIGLRSSDVFVGLLSEHYLGSRNVYGETHIAKAYIDHSEGKLFIPVVLDGIDPPIVRDITAIVSPKRDFEDVSHQIDQAISVFEGRRVAAEEEQKALNERIQISAAEYVDEAVKSLQGREKWERRVGFAWQAVGFLALVLGISFAFVSITQVGAKNSSWAEFAHLSLRSILIIALLGACAKYAFTLGKSYVSEALNSADRLHAIAFGKFYLRVFGSKIEWQELKEAFSQWNIARTSAFSSLNSTEIDPKIIDSLVEIVKAIAGKASDKK